MSEWLDCAEDWGMPYDTRMYKDVNGLNLRIGQYINKKWHWWIVQPDESLPLGKVLGSGVVPTQDWAKESAEEFAKKFLTLL